MPKRVKRRKQQRGRMTGRAHKGNKIAYGEFALVATECGWVKSNEIEAARVAMTRYIKRGGQVWIDIFPHKPVTKKPAETRMGSGKGSPEYWVAVVKPDRVLFEMSGIPEATAKEALRLAGHKLSVTTKFMTKADYAATEAKTPAAKENEKEAAAE
jgi:large subunit ribosomal protein L16